MTSRTHTPEDVEKIQSSWLTEERVEGVQVTSEGVQKCVDTDSITIEEKQ
jgi:hypothetical protein